MRKFLLKVTVFGLILVAVFVILEILVRSIPNEYSYKYDYLEKNIKNIQILAVGSSVGRSGIDPECFEYYTFNAANVSQDLETDCAIINKYIKNADSLQVVILPLLPMSYTYKTGEGKEGWRLRRYHIFMKLDVSSPMLKESYEMSNPQAACGQIIRGILRKNIVECFENGQGKDNELVDEKSKMQQGLDAASAHNAMYIKENYKIIIPLMESTIRECEKRGVKVLLVLMPTYFPYYQNVNPKALEECRAVSRKLERENANCKYVDFFTDDSYVSGDFRNSNHLSLEGARKLSNKLNDIIKKW